MISVPRRIAFRHGGPEKVTRARSTSRDCLGTFFRWRGYELRGGWASARPYLDRAQASFAHACPSLPRPPGRLRPHVSFACSTSASLAHACPPLARPPASFAHACPSLARPPASFAHACPSLARPPVSLTHARPSLARPPPSFDHACPSLARPPASLTHARPSLARPPVSPADACPSLARPRASVAHARRATGDARPPAARLHRDPHQRAYDAVHHRRKLTRHRLDVAEALCDEETGPRLPRRPERRAIPLRPQRRDSRHTRRGSRSTRRGRRITRRASPRTARPAAPPLRSRSGRDRRGPRAPHRGRPRVARGPRRGGSPRLAAACAWTAWWLGCRGPRGGCDPAPPRPKAHAGSAVHPRCAASETRALLPGAAI